MANNLYDYLNQFNLGQVVQGIPGTLQGVADFLNRNQIGTRGIKQTPSYYGPAYASAEALGIKPGGLRNYGTGYKEKELAAGAGFPGQQGMYTPPFPGPGATPPVAIDPYAAQNRAYQQERARVEAMVKANPDMQKQEIADARAKVRDQGMAIWAAANPELAKRLQPGQVGYDAVQQALIGNEAGQAMRQGYGFEIPQQITMTPPPGVNTPQGLPSVSSFSPGDMYGKEGIDFDPELRKKFQSLLNASQNK